VSAPVASPLTVAPPGGRGIPLPPCQAGAFEANGSLSPLALRSGPHWQAGRPWPRLRVEATSGDAQSARPGHHRPASPHGPKLPHSPTWAPAFARFVRERSKVHGATSHRGCGCSAPAVQHAATQPSTLRRRLQQRVLRNLRTDWRKAGRATANTLSQPSQTHNRHWHNLPLSTSLRVRKAERHAPETPERSRHQTATRLAELPSQMVLALPTQSDAPRVPGEPRLLGRRLADCNHTCKPPVAAGE
jgi:hypothetical protein